MTRSEGRLLLAYRLSNLLLRVISVAVCAVFVGIVEAVGSRSLVPAFDGFYGGDGGDAGWGWAWPVAPRYHSAKLQRSRVRVIARSHFSQDSAIA